MNKKLLAMGLSVSMIAGMLTGCGNASDDAQASTQPATQQTTAGQTSDSGDEPITLRFSWWGGDERNAATLDVIEQFEQLHPNVTIEAEYGGNDGYHDKLATQLASGTAADIVQVDPEIFPQYVNTGDYFIDYQDYSNMDLSTFDENYISLEINGRYDGKQLGLPTGISGAGILVNQDLADAIGLDFTKAYTWDDLFEMGKKVREYDDSMYLLCANKEYIVNLVVFNYGKQLCGKTLFDIESGQLNITEEQMKQVMEYVQKLYDEEVVAPASYQAAYSGDNLQSDANWIAGKYVCALTYISTIKTLTRIILPLMKPALFSAGLFQFLWTYNDYFNSLIFINSVKKYPISLALRMSLDAESVVQWGKVLAMATVAVVPVMILFFAAQKYFVEGIATSGLKG